MKWLYYYLLDWLRLMTKPSVQQLLILMMVNRLMFFWHLMKILIHPSLFTQAELDLYLPKKRFLFAKDVFWIVSFQVKGKRRGLKLGTSVFLIITEKQNYWNIWFIYELVYCSDAKGFLLAIKLVIQVSGDFLMTVPKVAWNVLCFTSETSLVLFQ